MRLTNTVLLAITLLLQPPCIPASTPGPLVVVSAWRRAAGARRTALYGA